MYNPPSLRSLRELLYYITYLRVCQALFLFFLKFFLKCSFQAVFTAPLSPTAFLFYRILPLLSTLFCIFLFFFCVPILYANIWGFSPFFIHHIWVFDFYLGDRKKALKLTNLGLRSFLTSPFQEYFFPIFT